MPPVTRLGLSILAVVSFVAGWLVRSPSPALAGTTQLAIFQDDSRLFSAPVQTLKVMRQLGAGMVRVTLYWNQIAPARRSAAFNPTDPGSYPAGVWSLYDEIARDAAADGLALDFTLSGGAPPWATGAGQPRSGGSSGWKPSASGYGAWVQAVGTRYSGNYNPMTNQIDPGNPNDLPRINFWEPWNEPNFGPELAPQATRGSTVPTAAAAYRAVLDAAWNGLRASGHGQDTIVIGNLDARGATAKPSRGAPQGLPGLFGATKPLQFIRALYCVDPAYRELRGGAAAAIGCPTSAAGSRRFRGAHPALFQAKGFGVHPYPFNLPPTEASSNDADFTEFSQLPALARALDRLQRIYGSGARLPIYNTEYGYITNPPNHSLPFVSPTTGAYYLNWAEYLSWRNSRIASTMQFLLYDPNPRKALEYGGFASGLMSYSGERKPAYNAYRLPLFLPVSSARRGQSIEVWGCVRPAHDASVDAGGSAQRVQIQFQRGSRGRFTTLRTVTISNIRGYFEVRMRFPASGSVRLAWSYPSADPLLTPSLVVGADQSNALYSRTASVTVK